MQGKNRIVVLSAFAFTTSILALGYIAFGLWTMMIFTSGFLGGFIIWLFTREGTPYSAIKAPYYLSFALFIGHRIEEKQAGFFQALSLITDVPTPEIMSWQIILLVLMSVGGWLMVPYLVKRRASFGYYLAWTFFTAMGVTELAHFIFPLFQETPYSYFPGMASVLLLAPVAWWGMWRLSGQTK